jgi:hypothetical protein
VCACVDIMRVQSNVYCGDRIAEYNRVAARRVCVLSVLLRHFVTSESVASRAFGFGEDWQGKRGSGRSAPR